MEKLELQGIQRLHDGINTDGGTCDEIINLRKKDGQWVLMHPKEGEYDLSSLYDIDSLDAIDASILLLWYKHPVSADGKFIAYHTIGSINDIIEVTSSASPPSSKVLLSLSSGEVCSKIYSFGYFLIVTTDLNVYYLSYDMEDYTYTLLPEIEHGTYSFASSDNRAASTHGWGNFKTAMSQLREEMNLLEKQGYVNGHVYFRVGFKLVDGNVIGSFSVTETNTENLHQEIENTQEESSDNTPIIIIPQFPKEKEKSSLSPTYTISENTQEIIIETPLEIVTLKKNTNTSISPLTGKRTS